MLSLFEPSAKGTKSPSVFEINLPPTASASKVTWRAARQQWRWFSFAVLGSTGYGVLTVLTATVLGHLVTTVAQPAVREGRFTTAMAWQVLWELGGVVALNVIAVIIRRIAAGITYNNLIALTRRRLTRAYQELPMSWHQQQAAGRLLSGANSDVEQIFAIFQPLPMALGVAIMLLFGFVSIFLNDVWLGVVALVVFPLLIALNFWFQSVMRRRVEASQSARALVSTVADESFDGALVVKALGRRDSETQRFASSAQQLRDANIQLGRTEGIFDPLTNAIPTIGTLLVVLVGAFRVRSGAITAGNVVEVAYLFNLLAFPVRAFGWILSSLPQAAIGWRRVKPIIDEADTARAAEVDAAGRTPVELPPGPLEVLVEHVSYDYDHQEAGREAVHDVSLEIPAGSTLAVVGETGSGKTTLVSMIAGLLPPTSGEVRLDDTPVAHVRNRHERIALATQAAFVFNESAVENVTLDRPTIDAASAEAALGYAHADNFIAELGDARDEPLGEAGSRLSGGQRQRVALARALAGRPGLLILDDATSAIDAAVEQDILATLPQATEGCTTILVAYRKSAIVLADRVAFLKGGRLEALGTHDELMATNADYARLLTAYDREDA